jgi:hypothetical protein
MVKIIGLLVVADIFILVSLYFLFLRRLTPIPGYISSITLIVSLIVSNVYAYDYLEKKGMIPSPKVETPTEVLTVSSADCTKEMIEIALNQLSKGENPDRNKQLLSCFDKPDFKVVIKEIVQKDTLAIVGKMREISAKEYLEGLKILQLGDSIKITNIQHNPTGRIIYMEIMEKQIK